MLNFDWYHFSFLLFAAVLDVISNIFLKYSNGFTRLGFGILSILFVLAAFSCLAVAVREIDLSVAYALWGGFGVIATAIAGLVLFGQNLNWRGWVGMVGLIIGMTLIKMA